MQDYSGFYIDGQWQPASGAERIEVINPATGLICAATPAATQRDVEVAITAARQAFPAWSNSSAQTRRELMLAAADAMDERADELINAITMTMGCPRHIALEIQVQGSIAAFRNFAHLTEQVERQEKGEGFIQVQEAIGVCVLINPWNYPLSQLVGKLGPALATGCTVVTKPAEQTPLQDLILADIFHQVGLPAGVFNVITGHGANIGEYLCSHPEVDLVSFTGSTQAGIKVAQAASTTVKRVCQELGGKSPYIITEDADLPSAVRYGVEDVMLNSGQTCCALTRMLVPASVYEQAVQLAKAIAEENVVGDPLDEAVSMGPLSSKAQQKKVLKYIQQGIEEGARLVTGSAEPPASLSLGAYVMPTIFADVNNQMSIAREEIFGPVLCMIPYKDEQDALDIANDTVFGLSSAVYAKDLSAAMNVASKIRAGQCYLQGSYFNTDVPFGGFKQSGNGREWGLEGLREFVEIKSIITQ